VVVSENRRKCSEASGEEALEGGGGTEVGNREAEKTSPVFDEVPTPTSRP
jgi:hypothetical protein